MEGKNGDTGYGFEMGPEANERIRKHMKGILTEIITELVRVGKEHKQPAGAALLNSYVALVQVIEQLCDTHHKTISEYLKDQAKTPKGPVS